MIPKTPSSKREFQETIWAHCRSCTGRERQVIGDCRDSSCALFPVYSLPRVNVLKFDFDDRLRDQLDCAVEVADKNGSFTVEAVRGHYFAKYGNGGALNWGALTARKEWRELFAFCGETKSLSERTHGKKVGVWNRKICPDCGSKMVGHNRCSSQCQTLKEA